MYSLSGGLYSSVFLTNTSSTNIFVKTIKKILPQYLPRTSARHLHVGLRVFAHFRTLVVGTLPLTVVLDYF